MFIIVEIDKHKFQDLTQIILSILFSVFRKNIPAYFLIAVFKKCTYALNVLKENSF